MGCAGQSGMAGAGVWVSAAVVAFWAFLAPWPAAATPQAELLTEFNPPAHCGGASQACTWQLTLGGEMEDKAYAVAAAQGAGVFVVGHTRSFGDLRYDGLVVRLGPGGDVIWQRVIGGPGSDQLYGVIATQDGGAVVAGHSGARGGVKADAWVVRFDRGGVKRWARRLGGPGDDRFRAIAAMPDGGFVAAGFTRSFGVGADDAWVVRFDGDGQTLWAKTFGGGLDDGAFDVTADRAGRITVGGFSRSSTTRTFEAWLFRLTDEGSLQWQRRFDLGSFNSVSAVTATADGGVLALGVAGGERLAQEESWAARFDGHGAMLWRRSFEGALRETGWGATTTADGDFVIALASSSGGRGSADARLLRLDPDGRRLWERVYGGALWDRPAALAVMPDETIVVGGYTTTRGAGYEDYWVLRLDADGLLR